MKCDVAVIGGGPAGSTVGSLLKKYNPDLSVAIFEREMFPRDHVGESQLPLLTEILHEMGVWDKVEAAGFPIKVGAVYRWGNTDDLWQFEFLPGEELKPVPRPAKFEGQRARTAFQVDRSVYDKILLDHAASLGCVVEEEAQVREIRTEGDEVTGLTVESGGKKTEVTARYYIDASGSSGMLRRKMRVDIDAPTSLRNIAIWDYWNDAKWAERLGIGGTKVQVMSLGWGWIWFIPISASRTSVGLITSAAHFKESGLTTEEIYSRSILAEPLISELTKEAKREMKLQTTTDWSYVAKRICGDNWFLVGDSCGFADPILAAGMTLAHSSGRKAAFTMLEMDRGKLGADWLRKEYDTGHRNNIASHIRFADYWYSANGCFTDLKEYCSSIAADAGLELNADAAFQWLGSGGFTHDILGQPVAATFRLSVVKWMASRFTDEPVSWQVGKFNRFILNLKGVSEETAANYAEGKVVRIPCYRKDKKLLPKVGLYVFAIDALRKHKEAVKAFELAFKTAQVGNPEINEVSLYTQMLEVFESLLTEGWISGEKVAGLPYLMKKSPAKKHVLG